MTLPITLRSNVRPTISAISLRNRVSLKFETLLSWRCLASVAVVPLIFACASAQTPYSEQSSLAVSAVAVRALSTALPEDPSARLLPDVIAASDSAADPKGIANSDSPTSQTSGAPTGGGMPPGPGTAGTPPHVASPYMKYIPPGWTAPEPISAKNKAVLGLRDLYNPLNFAAMFASAGYEQLLNGAPNYGTDRGAFGERLGAAAIRESTQGVFTDAIFAPLLREDPRYYIEGPQYGFVHRTLYAITRPLVTRTDSGRTSINGALLLGYAASSAVSYSYYPQINKNFRDTASTYGGGIGGAALGFFISEFSVDILHMLHMGKQP